MHSSSEFRHHAAAVLAAFSQTLITHRTLVDEETIESICYYTHSFLTPETTRHPTSSRKLPPLLDSAVSSKSFGNVGENAPWALTLVASFSVLLGPSLFLHQGPLKLVMNVTQRALRHHPGRDLNPHVWRTFIWLMTQLYMQQGSIASVDDDTIRRCVLVLKQAVHGGLGAALVWSLLGMTDSQNDGTRKRWVVSNTIEIVRDMLSSKSNEIRDEGCRLLVYLTCEARKSEGTLPEAAEWTSEPLLSPFLFDGSLLRADRYQIEEIMSSTPNFSPRCLSPDEILSHWESLSSRLVFVIQKCLQDYDTDLEVRASTPYPILFLIHRGRLSLFLCGGPCLLSEVRGSDQRDNPPPPILGHSYRPYCRSSYQISLSLYPEMLSQSHFN